MNNYIDLIYEYSKKWNMDMHQHYLPVECVFEKYNWCNYITINDVNIFFRIDKEDFFNEVDFNNARIRLTCKTTHWWNREPIYDTEYVGTPSEILEKSPNQLYDFFNAFSYQKGLLEKRYMLNNKFKINLIAIRLKELTFDVQQKKDIDSGYINLAFGDVNVFLNNEVLDEYSVKIVYKEYSKTINGDFESVISKIRDEFYRYIGNGFKLC